MDSFSRLHPLINFTYFLFVIMFSMFLMDPIFLGISLIGSMLYSVYLKGIKALKFNVIYMMPMIIFLTILNPLFNHEGATIILYINNNPITLEAIIYGVASAIMLVSVLIWFSAYNVVMTSDKFMYLFGRVMPKNSLIVAMVLRFVPRFKAQIKVISNGQKSIGKDITNGNIFERINHGVKILSMLITWALENAIETADSMKARGYGLKGRTSFYLYKFSLRDKIILGVLLVLIGITLCGISFELGSANYFPKIKINNISSIGLITYLTYFLLNIFPIIINVWEEIKWKLSK
ncbi:energy-coupling factor transporter transmembrane protein EcfT [Clostridium sp. Sa3CVN1]|uniref:Energy-coupling factor transporter transmembrane protein EcfT n=2 Tax=Clostridiaceae TaxID=31979 RepID=A0ABR8PP40_9CLOT|nr:energy-coupling factor transporter transmembrane protein EcfT [Clostridium cibarium]